MTLYLDVIWFLNFCIDLLLIMLTGLFLKRKLNRWRIIAGAFIGSSYVLLLFIPSTISLYHPFIKLLFSFVIMVVSFGFYKFTYLFKNVLMFYFVTFVTGGGMFAAHYFLEKDLAIQSGMFVTNGTGLGDPLSWLFVILGFPIIWYFSKRRVDDIQVEKIHYSELVNVQISIDDCVIHSVGLIDSGNKLVDPITKVPVMILDMTKHGSLFPEPIVRLAKDISAFTNEGENHPWESRLRVIPYRSVGRDQHFLTAIKPDSVVITGETKKIVTKKVLVGLNFTPLSSEGKFTCIVHPELMMMNYKDSAS